MQAANKEEEELGCWSFFKIGTTLWPPNLPAYEGRSRKAKKEKKHDTENKER